MRAALQKVAAQLSVGRRKTCECENYRKDLAKSKTREPIRKSQNVIEWAALVSFREQFGAAHSAKRKCRPTGGF
jgi:hypothetical protein